MIRSYTSLEQSKKLLELGLSPMSADMAYLYDHDDKIYCYRPICALPTGDDMPCWSLAALIELMPKYTLEGNELGLHRCLYSNIYRTNILHTPLDAAFKMICRLLENGHINKEEKK